MTRTNDKMAENNNPQVSIRYDAIASLILGFLGGAFFWWVPMGIVLSATGLLVGFVGWTIARPKSTNAKLLIAGMLLALATLILDTVIAVLDLEIIVLHSFR